MNLVGCEDKWIEIHLASKDKFIIGCVYRHPQQNYHMFAELFCGT